MGRTIFALFDDALAGLGATAACEREGVPRGAVTLLVPDPRGGFRPATWRPYLYATVRTGLPGSHSVTTILSALISFVASTAIRSAAS